ncbi:hypothetical protein SPSYN_00341 [Sporotomaculum syntrophicum]|uniref:Secreted protein n=1 Tax=Sporotomaculum syntrophicum TaxID=182264 RepID=A0A9D3AZ10_9FIRM|nr:hypothetical protein SPSYN_00341 [Sporotomaculum syntrophicum]
MFLLLLNNNFMLTKALLMNPAVAQSAALHARLLTTGVAATAMVVKDAKCLMQSVRPVVKRPRSHSNLAVINLCTAVTATDPVIAGKMINLKARAFAALVL